MQQLFPDHRSMPLDELYRGLTLPEGDGHPWLAIGMVSTLDGGAAVGGDTWNLGGAADDMAFGRLRAATDAIMVGAGTVRSEGYGPPVGPPERWADRAARGLAERPRLVIVSGVLGLEPDHRVFSDPSYRPLVATHDGAPTSTALAGVADVVRIGRATVDLPGLLARLFDEGVRRVLCEGGPRLNGALLDADLVDEMFLTFSPLAIGGEVSRIIRSGDPEVQRPFTLISLFEHDGELVARYRRDR